jgi:hypothetical protein
MMLGELIFDFEMLGGVWNTANAIKKVALLLMPLFMLIESGSAIVRYLSGKEGNYFPDFSKFYSFILLWVCLVFYTPIMRTFDKAVTAIIHYVDDLTVSGLSQNYYQDDGGGGIGLALFKMKYAALEGGIGKEMEVIEKEQQVKPGDASVLNNLTSFLTNMTAGAGSVAVMFTEFIADGATWIIRYLIEILSFLLVSVLIVIGPLAVAFNTAPFFGPGTLVKWFTAWLGVKCWLLTMSCLDLMIEIISNSAIMDMFSQPSPISTMMKTSSLNYAMIIAYLMVPWLTNKYINNDGGGMMGTAMRGASSIKSAASAVSTKGASLATKLMK